MITTLHAAHPDRSIRRLCDLFGVGRTWYYTHPTPEETATRDVALRVAIEDLVLAFPGYGYRRVTKQPQRDGWTVNHKRGLRVMREESLLCQLKQRFVVTTDAGHGLRRYPNLVTDLAVERPDQVWQADLTSIRLLDDRRLPGLPPGRLLAPLCRLGIVADHRHGTHARRAGTGALVPSAWIRADPSL